MKCGHVFAVPLPTVFSILPRLRLRSFAFCADILAHTGGDITAHHQRLTTKIRLKYRQRRTSRKQHRQYLAHNSLIIKELAEYAEWQVFYFFGGLFGVGVKIDVWQVRYVVPPLLQVCHDIEPDIRVAELVEHVLSV